MPDTTEIPTPPPPSRRRVFLTNVDNRLYTIVDDAIMFPTRAKMWQLLAATIVIIGLALGVAYAVVMLLVTVVVGLWYALVDAGKGVMLYVDHWQITHLITRGLHHFLAVQATGTGLSPDLLAKMWGGLLLVLLVFGAVGSSGARYGWVVAGAATTIMVWMGTPHGHRELAAVVTAGAWAALSTVALGMAGNHITVRRLFVENHRTIRAVTPRPAPTMPVPTPADPKPVHLSVLKPADDAE